MSKQLLKERLSEMKKNDFKIPTDLNAFDLALNMMEHVGDIDSELRDELIFEAFCEWVDVDVFTDEQLKELLNICLNDSHMFYKIGEEGTDSVFTRSFSALIAYVFVYALGEDDTLSHDEVQAIKEKAIKYMDNEKDIRGYVQEKGWAHSAAHTGDLLVALAECKNIEAEDMKDILQAIKRKVCINNYVYINQEDERIAIPVTTIIENNVLEEAEIIKWIKEFENLDKIKRYPEDQYLVVNVKNLLRSIYFRLPKENNSGAISEAIKETLKKVIGF